MVIFVVMNDGQENSSKEFTKAQIKEMIERQQNVYNWHFTFLASNQDAFAEAGGMGIGASGTANWAMEKAAAAYRATSDKVARMRAQASQGKTVSNSFSDEEREKVK